MTSPIPSADVKTFSTIDFRLRSGAASPEVTLAYRTLGALALF
jgi:hypothetical protein